MLVYPITFENLDGEEVTEEHHFHLTELEYTEYEVSYPGGIEKTLEKAGLEQDGKVLLNAFKDLIDKAYGKRIGNRFDKNPVYLNEFKQTNAYSHLVLSLLKDMDTALDFFIGCLPQKNQKAVLEYMAQNK